MLPCFLLLVVVSSCQSASNSSAPQILTFDQFLAKFNLSFDPSQYQLRKDIYQSNLTEFINNPCEWCGITPFFANTYEEIHQNRKLFLPLNIDELAKAQTQKEQSQSTIIEDAKKMMLKLGAPSSLDWRNENVVTPVKAQGACGTCWSFATVAMCQSSLILQGKAFNNALYTIDLSEQYLLKCTRGSSCNGGYLETALDKALEKGLPYESEYPYTPFTTSYTLAYGLCYTSDLVKVSNKSRNSMYGVSDDIIIQMLQDGPVTAAVSSEGWEKYSSGVYRCSNRPSIDHAVLIVGYTSDYWIIKNSWGTSFGESGYIRVTRDRSSNCRIGVAVHELAQQALIVYWFMSLLVFVSILW